MRRQKTDDKDLFGHDSDEFINIPDMPPIGSDKIVYGKGLKILTPNNLLTRLPKLLAKIKSGSNSYKLKNESRQIQYVLYQDNKITKKVFNNLMKPLQ